MNSVGTFGAGAFGASGGSVVDRAGRLPHEANPLKRLVHRSFEALMVESVVRNVLQRTDRVLEWVAAQTASTPDEVVAATGVGVEATPDDEAWEPSNVLKRQALVDVVIDALYRFEVDRTTVRQDPLVRLLLSNPADLRFSNFTVVFAAGVITEGAKGEEMWAAFARLTMRRGVPVRRADTATARSLAFNARKIEEAVGSVGTATWGWVGYSQGCANGLQAESDLLSGTPAQREMLHGLVSRNLLFGAHNGSSHAEAGGAKLDAAVVHAEQSGKMWQARLSKQLYDVGLDTIKLALGSKMAAHTVGGLFSLSRRSAVELWREGQHLAGVPTFAVRGVVEPDVNRPEALDYMANVYTAQRQSLNRPRSAVAAGAGTAAAALTEEEDVASQHDSQVALEDSVGAPTCVDNANARRMRLNHVGCLAQRTHHWSPLNDKVVGWIITERDRARCSYDAPADRHIFPWVESLARFGLIEATPAHDDGLAADGDPSASGSSTEGSSSWSVVSG